MTFVEKLMLFSTDIFYSTMVTQVKKIIEKKNGETTIKKRMLRQQLYN